MITTNRGIDYSDSRTISRTLERSAARRREEASRKDDAGPFAEDEMIDKHIGYDPTPARRAAEARKEMDAPEPRDI